MISVVEVQSVILLSIFYNDVVFGLLVFGGDVVLVMVVVLLGVFVGVNVFFVFGFWVKVKDLRDMEDVVCWVDVLGLLLLV